MRKFPFVLIVGILAALFLSACQRSNPLVETRWQLTLLNGMPVIPDVAVTLNLGKGEIGGSDGCNTFGGSYTRKGDSLTFGEDVFSTMMYCGDGINAQSTAFYQVLTQTRAYTMDGSSLVLLDEQGVSLAVFIPMVD